MALLRILLESHAAGHAEARMAVAEERLRFSHDVHDVLGRRFSTIAVLSELAASLSERGDDRAAVRMLEVRSLAHEALDEARELARGYRPVDLAHELEGARALLRSAAIEVSLDVAVVPDAWHEAAAWVVRESVTNVLRHSRARRVRISFVHEVLCVSNDGAGGVAERRDAVHGVGLQGLRERLEPLGATLVAGQSDDRWTVAARMPGPGPTSIATVDRIEPACRAVR